MPSFGPGGSRQTFAEIGRTMCSTAKRVNVAPRPGEIQMRCFAHIDKDRKIAHSRYRGSGNLSQSGMWSLTLCSNFASSAFFSTLDSEPKDVPHKAWANRLTKSNTP